MKIEVGEYVRTKDGYIFKILTKENTNYGCCGITDSNNTKYTTYTYNKRSFNDIKNKIVKHSKNIIDLVEVGDYINENRVYKITSACIYCVGKAVQNKLTINIETILTKEQMEANQYYVEKDKRI